ncbi:MAG: hypothetical protein ACLGIP_18410 [Alphaproteobacteria bacterium]
MKLVYVRVVLYFVAPLLGLLPGVTYDAAAAQIIVDLEAAAVGLAASALFTGAIFAKWGKK